MDYITDEKQVEQNKLHLRSVTESEPFPVTAMNS